MALRCLSFIWLVLLAGSGLAQAGSADVPAGLKMNPSTVKEGSDRRTTLQTIVTLKAPAQSYFICEVRSPDRRKIDCASIIFKKGDIEGKGTGTVYWSNITADEVLKMTAFNVNAPDALVTFAVTLRKKDGEMP